MKLYKRPEKETDPNKLPGQIINRPTHFEQPLEKAIDDYKAKDLLQLAYEEGWCNAAAWANRVDLITDCDSGAYERERDERLTKLKERFK